MLVQALSQTTVHPGATANPQSKVQHRPPVDWWEVGDQRFESTRELIDSGQVPREGSQASYHYQTAVPKPGDPHQGKNIIAGAVAGAAGAAGASCIAVSALEFMGELANVLLSGPYYRPGTGVSDGAYLTVALVSAAVGGIAGGLFLGAAVQNQADRGNVVRGTIRQESTPTGEPKAIFYPGQKVTNGIDLNDYAEATELPEVEVPRGTWWKDSLLGAGAGAAASLSVFIPFVGLLAPTAAGAMVGSSATEGEFHGGVVGGAVGAAATAGILTAISSYGAAGFGAAAGIMTAGGATVGPFVLPSVREHFAKEDQLSLQWWHQHHRQQTNG